MASEVSNTRRSVSRAALATTYEGVGNDLLERIVPLVDYLEIPPDSIARSHAGRASLIEIRPEASSPVGDRAAAVP